MSCACSRAGSSRCPRSSSPPIATTSSPAAIRCAQCSASSVRARCASASPRCRRRRSQRSRPSRESTPDALYRQTNGNPFFVTEALAAGGEGVPETVRDAVLARAARLGDGARRLLDAVAVVPPHVERPLLDRLVPNADAALDECTTAGMLRADARPRRASATSWRGSRSRDTLPPGARRTLHRAVLAALLDVATSIPLGSHTTPRRRKTPRRSSASRPRRPRGLPPSGPHREAAEQYARALRHDADVEPAVRAGLARAARDLVLPDRPERRGARSAARCGADLSRARRRGLRGIRAEAPLRVPLVPGLRRRVACGGAASGRAVGAAWSEPRAGPCVRPDGIPRRASVAVR